tara:strand:- start:8436 stop:8732 length:297 start_codon:yes stop_codon:yes gene_type:complete
MGEGKKEINTATSLLSSMTNRLNKDGLRVIALCEEAEGRMLMLGLMEFMNNQSIAILKQLKVEREAKLVMVEGCKEDIAENMLSAMSPISELITEDKN